MMIQAFNVNPEELEEALFLQKYFHKLLIIFISSNSERVMKEVFQIIQKKRDKYTQKETKDR